MLFIPNPSRFASSEQAGSSPWLPRAPGSTWPPLSQRLGERAFPPGGREGQPPEPAGPHQQARPSLGESSGGSSPPPRKTALCGPNPRRRNRRNSPGGEARDRGQALHYCPGQISASLHLHPAPLLILFRIYSQVYRHVRRLKRRAVLCYIFPLYYTKLRGSRWTRL